MSVVHEVRSLDNLDRIISEGYVTVVDFAAPAWCQPCKRLAPHYEAVAGVLTAATFVHVDIDTCEPALVEAYSVQSVPTVNLYRDGIFVRTLVPSEFNAPKLTSAVNALL